MSSTLPQKFLIFAASAGVTSAFFINFCALVFQCGCHSLWAGADTLCNIHHPEMRHCPWCAHNPAWAYLAMIIPQGLISFAPRAVSVKARLAAALGAFPVFGGIAAAIYGMASGYWRS